MNGECCDVVSGATKWMQEEQRIFAEAIEAILVQHWPPHGQPSVLGTEMLR